MHAEHFTGAAKVYADLPKRISGQLRRVLEATAPPDEFSCHCTLLEALAKYINVLCNSVYVASGVENSAIELQLRTLSPNSLSFGHLVAGLRTFRRLHAKLETHIPELAKILTAKTLPDPCVRQVKSFQAIKAARENYEIPVRRLHQYVASQVPENHPLGKADIVAYLSEVVEFRNRGVGHRADEGWFAQDSGFYALLNEHLRPSIDALITWPPMQALLTSYELVQISAQSSTDTAIEGGYPISRPERLEGRVPLGTSRLRLVGPPPLAATKYVARRTDNEALLEPVVAQVPFPSTLQSTEALHWRYRRHYLRTYLDRGVITPSQRQDDLDVLRAELALPVNDAHKAEAKIHTLVDQCSGAEDGDQTALTELLDFIHPDDTEEFETRILTLIAQFPERRKDYVYQIIENNVVTSFDQLKLESELSETDLTDVLDDLEKADGKIRRVDALSGDNKQSQAYFKVQDLQKLHRFHAMLAQLGEIARPAPRFPAVFWELFRLCRDLLKDDGFGPENNEDAIKQLNSYRDYFAVDADSAETLQGDDDASPMSLLLENREIGASSVRSLLTQAWTELLRRGIDTSPVLPFFIGRTRLLVNVQPYHANGTPFKHPIEHEGVYFEGNLTRSQALNELIRLLTKLHVRASSPNVEVEYTPSDDSADFSPRRGGGSNALGILIEDPRRGHSRSISGSTVRHFYSNLLKYLLDRDVDLSEISPFPAGRVRFLLAEEPYHDNGRRFQAVAEKGGYFMEAAFPHAQAITHALKLCEGLDLRARSLLDNEYPDDADHHGHDLLTIDIGSERATGRSVPEFFESSVRCLFGQGHLVDEDIPYKSGRVRYFIARTPYHGPEHEFARPIQVEIDGNVYFIEANMSRNGAVELMQKLLDTKIDPQEFGHAAE